MHRFETIDLGEYRGANYFLTGFVEPEPMEEFDPLTDAERYGVSVAKSGERPFESNVEIVRMDNAHGQPHLDKEYLPSNVNKPRKLWFEEGYSYRRMKRYLLANWQTFADLSIQYKE